MRGVAKADLPSRRCAHCGRDFLWRKRWARCWDTVKFCSDACRRGKVPVPAATTTTATRRGAR
jgi:hypothetical protein